MVEKQEYSSFKKIFSRTVAAGWIAGIGALGGTLTNQRSVEAADAKSMEVSSLMVPEAEAMEIAGLVQMKTEYPTPLPVYTTKERETNFKDLEAVNSEEGKKTVISFLTGINRMINEENPEYRTEEIAGISLYFSDDTNKDGVVGFSPSFLVRDQQTGEVKPYTFSKDSLENETKSPNIIDLSASGEGYELECREIDGQATFTRKIEGVTEQYLDNAGEWQYYISEKMAKRFAEFDKHGCDDWENPCPATAEDWKNRTLLMYAKTKATEFSKETKNITLGVTEDFGDLTFSKNAVNKVTGKSFVTCTFKTGTVPSKFVAHFSIKADGKYFWQDFNLDVAQNLNVGDPEKVNGFLIYATLSTQPRDIIFEKMGYTMPKRYDKSTYKNPPAKGVSMYSDMAYYGADEINKLLDQWVETSIIPKELENKILQPRITYGDGSCFRTID